MDSSQPDLLQRRADRLTTAFSSEPIEDSAVRDAVCAYVDEAKRRGWTIERVIIAVKTMAERDAGPLRRALKDPGRRTQAEQQINRAITWCINHYFGSGEASGPMEFGTPSS